MGWANDDAMKTLGGRQALAAVAGNLPDTLHQSVSHLIESPAAFGETLRRRFDGQADSLLRAREDLAKTQQTAAERKHEIAELQQRNRLLAALLLHSFDQHLLSWEPGAIEATLDGVKDRDLMLRRDPASGTLYLRAAPKGDPEPWERL